MRLHCITFIFFSCKTAPIGIFVTHFFPPTPFPSKRGERKRELFYLPSLATPTLDFLGLAALRLLSFFPPRTARRDDDVSAAPLSTHGAEIRVWACARTSLRRIVHPRAKDEAARFAGGTPLHEMKPAPSPLSRAPDVPSRAVGGWRTWPALAGSSARRAPPGPSWPPLCSLARLAPSLTPPFAPPFAPLPPSLSRSPGLSQLVRRVRFQRAHRLPPVARHHHPRRPLPARPLALARGACGLPLPAHVQA